MRRAVLPVTLTALMLAQTGCDYLSGVSRIDSRSKARVQKEERTLPGRVKSFLRRGIKRNKDEYHKAYPDERKKIDAILKETTNWDGFEPPDLFPDLTQDPAYQKLLKLAEMRKKVRIEPDPEPPKKSSNVLKIEPGLTASFLGSTFTFDRKYLNSVEPKNDPFFVDRKMGDPVYQISLDSQSFEHNYTSHFKLGRRFFRIRNSLRSISGQGSSNLLDILQRNSSLSQDPKKVNMSKEDEIKFLATYNATVRGYSWLGVGDPERVKRESFGDKYTKATTSNIFKFVQQRIQQVEGMFLPQLLIERNDETTPEEIRNLNPRQLMRDIPSFYSRLNDEQKELLGDISIYEVGLDYPAHTKFGQNFKRNCRKDLFRRMTAQQLLGVFNLASKETGERLPAYDAISNVVGWELIKFNPRLSNLRELSSDQILRKNDIFLTASGKYFGAMVGYFKQHNMSYELPDGSSKKIENVYDALAKTTTMKQSELRDMHKFMTASIFGQKMARKLYDKPEPAFTVQTDNS